MHRLTEQRSQGLNRLDTSVSVSQSIDTSLCYFPVIPSPWCLTKESLIFLHSYELTLQYITSV